MLLVSFVVLPVLGLVLQGVASAVALLLLVFVIYYLVGPTLFSRTPWEGPYKDRDFGGPFG